MLMATQVPHGWSGPALMCYGSTATPRGCHSLSVDRLLRIIVACNWWVDRQCYKNKTYLALMHFSGQSIAAALRKQMHQG